ncbi:MAG: M48 family metallopeptidase [Methanosphaera stadtmanae]|nr:M48 family metallopeptidase [Methanosphaera stadtmanae]
MKKTQVHKIKIKDIELEYSVTYRKVKYIRYELRKGKLFLILPKSNKDNIEEVIHKKDNWIYGKIMEYNKEKEILSDKTKDLNLIQRSLPELKSLVNVYIEKYEKILNVKVNRLQFRDTVYKWGSCSTLRNVTLSKNLRFLPDRLVEYIVYHELTHIIVLAHDDKFFEIIKREFPNYILCDEKLNEYNFLIENTF